MASIQSYSYWSQTMLTSNACKVHFKFQSLLWSKQCQSFQLHVLEMAALPPPYFKGPGKAGFGAKWLRVVHYNHEGRRQHNRRKIIIITCFLCYIVNVRDHLIILEFVKNVREAKVEADMHCPPLLHENWRELFLNTIFARSVWRQTQTARSDFRLALLTHSFETDVKVKLLGCAFCWYQ